LGAMATAVQGVHQHSERAAIWKHLYFLYLNTRHCKL
jgi:hypothetical protein